VAIKPPTPITTPFKKSLREILRSIPSSRSVFFVVILSQVGVVVVAPIITCGAEVHSRLPVESMQGVVQNCVYRRPLLSRLLDGPLASGRAGEMVGFPVVLAAYMGDREDQRAS